METSILNSTKKILGLATDYTAFDHDIITHINTAFSTLTQLGVGPSLGFSIEDEDAEWPEWITEDPQYNSIKTYLYLKTRILFDPPQTSFLINAMNEQIQELEWRLNAHREETQWVDPDPDDELEPVEVVDGGGV